MATQIYSVLPGRPFGRGTTDATITSDPNTRAYATASGTTVALGSAILSNGDLAVIHQTWGDSGTATDNWEVFVVASGGGTTSITTTTTLSRSYIAGAQVIKIPEYKDLTIGATIAGKSYGNQVNSTADNRHTAIGGFNAIAVSGTLYLNNLIHQNGYIGYLSSSDRGGMNENQHFYWWYANAPSGGHVGGANTTDGNAGAKGGNSYYGYRGTEGNTNEQNGGSSGNSGSSGAGGGNATDGSPAQSTTQGGYAVGNAALTSMHFGGGGGGAANNPGAAYWTGSSGGGIWLIWAKNIVMGASGGIQCKGGNAGNNNSYGGGGGAGGSILINCETADIGTSKIDTNYGTYWTGYPYAGHGSIGRTRINYGVSLTGTTANTSFSSANNPLLIDQKGGAFIYNLLS